MAFHEIEKFIYLGTYISSMLQLSLSSRVKLFKKKLANQHGGHINLEVWKTCVTEHLPHPVEPYALHKLCASIE